MDILNIVNSEVFIIVISGVVIFAFQKLISDIWINPNLDFSKSLSKIETLLVKSRGMYRYTYKKNNSVSSSGLTMDEEIENLRKEINMATWQLISSYHSLFFAEKLWLKLLRVDIDKARPSLMTLSVTICSENDWKQSDGGPISGKEIDKIYNHLRIKKHFKELL